MAREQLDAILDTLIRFAQQQLAKRGAFHPFGASVLLSGEINLDAVYEEGQQFQVMIDVLVDGFRSRRHEYSVIGICFDARVIDPNTGEKTDAIAVSLEGVNDDAVTVYLPYSRSRFRGMKYGEIFATAGERQVFIDAT